ncbi:HPP family protein [Roseateles sp. BYS87W]|uniref:HPP family protein n=1 Tax=Pelomonas baiyunensis TaxID=3299026 RepID=A0ABW7GZC1_9BURK
MNDVAPPSDPAPASGLRAPRWARAVRHALAQPSAAPRVSLHSGLLACAGVFTVIAVLGWCSFQAHTLLLLGSFGSTAVMVFTFPELHFSQPRSVIGGHVICTAVGLAALAAFGPSWWALAGAAAASAALMMLSGTLHPPAGSNPIIVFLAAPTWSFLLFPTLFGALVLVGVAVLYHRATGRTYPRYWR